GGAIVAHLILNVAQGRKQRRVAFAFLNRLAQQVDRAFALAFQVQRNGLRQRTVGALGPAVVNYRNGLRGSSGFHNSIQSAESLLPEPPLGLGFRKYRRRSCPENLHSLQPSSNRAGLSRRGR